MSIPWAFWHGFLEFLSLNDNAFPMLWLAIPYIIYNAREILFKIRETVLPSKYTVSLASKGGNQALLDGRLL